VQPSGGGEGRRCILRHAAGESPHTPWSSLRSAPPAPGLPQGALQKCYPFQNDDITIFTFVERLLRGKYKLRIFYVAVHDACGATISMIDI